MMRYLLLLAVVAIGCVSSTEVSPATQPETPVQPTEAQPETPPTPPESQPETLDGYYASIDYSCETEQDCEIKDVHNCCGYYPECVKVGAQTSPSLVRELCQKEGMGSICGFPSIDACRCIEGRCEGVSG